MAEVGDTIRDPDTGESCVVVWNGRVQPRRINGTQPKPREPRVPGWVREVADPIAGFRGRIVLFKRGA